MVTPTQFAGTSRPDPSLFYRRGDPNDVRMGETAQTLPANYAGATVVLLGFPDDEGVRRNRGRMGAAAAPDAIRDSFYRLAALPLDAHGLTLFDLGNTIVQPSLEATHALHRQIVRQVIADGKTLIVFGGGNDVSYPDCAGLADATASVLAFNVDAHFDVRAGTESNSGTPYRQLLEEGCLQPDHFYEMGHQSFANSAVYRQYLADKGAHVVSCRELQAVGVRRSFERVLTAVNADAIFWGVDLDSVRVADAPGVSAPNALGLTANELCEIAALAGADSRTRLIEFSEVNPTYDLDRRTSRLTAVAVHTFLQALLDRTIS